MTSCSIRSTAITAKPTPVSVNGVTIPRDAIAREVQQHPAPTPLAAWKEAARALAVRELLLQEARRLELSGEPLSDGEGRRETGDEAAIRVLIESEVAVPEPDEAACRRYYEQNRGRFRSADIYEAAHILIAEQMFHRPVGIGIALGSCQPTPGRSDKHVRAHGLCSYCWTISLERPGLRHRNAPHAHKPADVVGEQAYLYRVVRAEIRRRLANRQRVVDDSH